MSKKLQSNKKMIRITISLNDQIQEKLFDLQKYLIKKNNKPHSISKIINTVLVAGILSSTKLSIYDWGVVKSFLDGKKIDLKEMAADEYVTNISALVPDV